MHHATRPGAGVLTVLEHLHTVHKDMQHAGGILVRFVIRRVVLNPDRIENDDVRKITRLQRATTVEFEICCRQSAQSSNGLFERNNFLIANIFAKQAREIAVGARMRV